MDNVTKIKSKAALVTVRLDQIVPNPFQPRKAFDEEKLLELANDIAEHGLMQPPSVRLSPAEWFLDPASKFDPDTKTKIEGFYVLNRNWIVPDKSGQGNDYRNDAGEGVSCGEFYPTRKEAEATLPRYELVAGERRVRACRKTPFTSIDAFLTELTDEEMAERAISENAQREDVSPLEEARAVARYMRTFGKTQQDASGRCGVSRSRIANRLRLLKLPNEVLLLISQKKLSESHGVILAGLLDLGEPFVIYYANKIAEKGIPTKTLEKGLALDYDDKDKLKGIAIESAGYGTKFPVKLAMREHPKAFRPTYNSGLIWCFDLELYATLTAQADELHARQKEIQKQEREAMIAELNAKGDGKYVDSTSLKWDEYRSLPNDQQHRVEGCTNCCPCFATGVGNDGYKFTLCLDPNGRLKCLGQASFAAKKAEVEAKADAAAAPPAAPSGTGTEATGQSSDDKSTEEIFASANEVLEKKTSLVVCLVAYFCLTADINGALGHSLERVIKLRQHEFDLEAWRVATPLQRLKQLQQLPQLALIKLAAQTQLYDEIGESVWSGDESGVVEWLNSLSEQGVTA